ncbi:MAG: hypothetical protein NC417_13625 [Candidatus Gastranaerophilales bacterium]|nr:hypothetical protein [Candidatus Gastranaerophilales bacterium]
MTVFDISEDNKRYALEVGEAANMDIDFEVCDILNFEQSAIIKNGFCLKKFDEHPTWTNDKLPGEFTAIAVKRGELA